MQTKAIRYPTDARPYDRALGGARAEGRAVDQAELPEGGPPPGDVGEPLRPRPTDEAVKGVPAQIADKSG